MENVWTINENCGFSEERDWKHLGKNLRHLKQKYNCILNVTQKYIIIILYYIYLIIACVYGLEINIHWLHIYIFKHLLKIYM